MPPFVLVSIGAGLLSAVLYGSAASGIGLSIIPMYLSPLPLFLIGLSYGGMAALVGGLSATAALALVGGPLLAIAFFLSNAAAPILLARVANWSRAFVDQNGQSVTEYYPTGLLFAWLSGLGIAIALALTLYMQTLEGGFAGWLPSIIEIKVLTDAIVQAQIQSGGVPTDEMVLQERLIRLALPGLALFWALISIGNGALAQRIAVRFGRNLRPSPELLNMNLPQFMLLPLVGGVVLAFLPGDFGFFGSVMVTLAAVPYFFLGLATVHVISHRLPGRAFALSGVYILLAALGWPLLLIVGIGIVEHFVNLRLTYGVVKP
jgi:hypothetical protein